MMSNSAWSDAWSSVNPTPFSSSLQNKLPQQQRGPSMHGLIQSATVKEKSTQFTVLIEQDAIVGDSKVEKGKEIEITLWNQQEVEVGAMDRACLTDCTVSPSKKEPGKMYYNCKSVQLEQSWIKVCADDTYLAKQSFVGTHKFILTSREVNSDGFRSMMVWPDDVSMTKKDGVEIQLLTFRGKYMTADSEKPATFEFKLWASHCEQLIPGGPLSMDQWKALMSNHRNMIPFAVVCSIDTSGKFTPIGGGQLLKVHALRSDIRGYLLSCPSVSRALVKKHTPASTKKDAVEGDIVNVSAVGLSKAGAFPVFRAMTSNPDELTSEAAVEKALADTAAAETIMFFGLADTERLGKKAKTK